VAAEKDYCPIWGIKFTDVVDANGYHCCPERTLRAIDAAHRRDDDTPTVPAWPSEASRLYQGLTAAEQDDRSDGDADDIR
jgi:hypothetical protein